MSGPVSMTNRSADHIQRFLLDWQRWEACSLKSVGGALHLETELEVSDGQMITQQLLSKAFVHLPKKLFGLILLGNTQRELYEDIRLHRTYAALGLLGLLSVNGLK